MLHRCFRKSEREWNSSNSGSAQVIEFSLVFPVVLITSISLLTIMFLLMIYVYSYNLSETASNMAVQNVGESKVYWQLSKQTLSKEKTEAINEYLDKKCKALCFLPGMKVDYSFEESGDGRMAETVITTTYWGKTLFSISSETSLRKPVEFADNVDLLTDTISEADIPSRLRELYEDYVDKGKRYAVF